MASSINNSNHKLKTTVGPTDRKRANLEAEKGETVLTNLSEGNNIYELKKIGGKKHSKGGTPLNLPAGENPGEGSSFIFSDNKKLMMKNKDELAFFGIKGSKGMTPAEISNKHVDAIAKAKATILDKYADAISKKTAEKNLDNSRFALSALALWQESKKGMKDGASDHFASFFDKTQTSPEDIFNVNPEEQQKLGEQMTAAFGGQMRKYANGGAVYQIIELPKFKDGDDTKYKTYTKDQLPAGVTPKKAGASYRVGDYVEQPDGTYRKVTFLDTKVNTTNTKTRTEDFKAWAAQSEDNKQLLEQANAAIRKGIVDGTIIERPEGSGKIIITGNFKPSFEDRVAISDIVNLSGKAFKTDKFKIINQSSTPGYSGKKGSFVAGFEPLDYEKRYALEKLKAQGYSRTEAFDELKKLYNDPEKAKEIRKEFATFLGVPVGKDEDLNSANFYKNHYGDITQGIESKLLKSGDYRPAMGDDALSGFEHFDAFGMTASPLYEQEAKKDEYDKGKDPEHLNTEQAIPDVFDFRKEDINSLNRAINAKHSIRRYDPWSKGIQMQQPETMFYSPERQIAAINEQLAQGIQGVNAFATPGEAASATSEMQGNAYAQVANVIGNYDDKNVGLFNTASERNTQLANAQNAQDSQQATSMYDKRVTLKQQFDNSLNAAKDKITELSNQAWTNAANIFNLNKTTENFKKDPYTGLITKVKDKEIVPLDSDKASAERFNAFAAAINDPEVSADMKAKMYIKLFGNDKTEDGITYADEI